MMQASEQCKDFIKSFEDCRLVAYPDPKTGGVPWTCGWGSTTGVGPGTVWTQETADEQFEADIRVAERLVEHFVTAPMTQGQFDAFVSIFQNVGPGNGHKDGIGRLRNGQPSTLLRMFNQGNIMRTQEEWVKWISPGTSVAAGLLRRRKGELVMFNRKDTT